MQVAAVWNVIVRTPIIVTLHYEYRSLLYIFILVVDKSDALEIHRDISYYAAIILVSITRCLIFSYVVFRC